MANGNFKRRPAGKPGDSLFSSSDTYKRLLPYLVIGLLMFTVLKRFLFAAPTMASAESKTKVQNLIKNKSIFIASKSYCPYCAKAKATVSSITKEAYILELDQIDDGAEIQDALYEITGQKSVPNVFIAGEHIGGNSDVQALQAQEKLEPMIKAAL